MTIRRIYLTISAFLLTISCMAQEPQALQVRQLTLKNGMTVWLNEDHSQPKIYGAVVVRAGAKDCPGTGIAHYFEHIMFKGTDRIGTTDYAAEKPWLDSISAQYDLLAQTTEATRRTEIQQKINQLSLKAADYAIPNEFNRLVSRFGGSDLNAATGYDVTYYHNLFLPQYLRQWCHLNSERILHPVFRLFQGELENVYEEKNRSEDAMGGALEKAMRAIFGSHPYAEPILGSTESLKNPRLSEMEAFYKKYYVGSNMGLILCGDLPAEDIEPILEQTFGRLPQGEPIDRGGDKPFSVERKRIDIRLPIPIIKAEAERWVETGKPLIIAGDFNDDGTDSEMEGARGVLTKYLQQNGFTYHTSLTTPTWSDGIYVIDHIISYDPIGGVKKVSTEVINDKVTSDHMPIVGDFIIGFDDATGINSLSPAPAPGSGEETLNAEWANGKCYDLSGRMVTGNRLDGKSSRGIYIIGGEKILK
jgi:hypothetical protein